MTRVSLFDIWTILLGAGFVRRKSSEEIALAAPGRTIYATTYDTKGMSPEDAMRKMLASRSATTLSEFREKRVTGLSHAYLIKEDGHFSLYALTAREGSLCHMALYFDAEADLAWALDVWRSTRPYVNGPTAYVSARVVAGQPVHWLYRESSDAPSDSGWRMFAEGDTDEDVNDPSRVAREQLAFVLESNPSLADLLDASAGTAFEWRPDVEDFQRVEFGPPEES